MEKDNSKVPVAILSCFLMAFILQGVLKLSGVLVFEKALEWGIFKIIDNSLVLNILFNAFIMFVVAYCLSFSLTTKHYSDKWYHYILLIVSSISVISIRVMIPISAQLNIILEVLAYIVVPTIINLTTKKNNRLFGDTFFEFLITISLQIFFYFNYLGLSYWSGMLNSMLSFNQVWLSSSSMFLTKFETYIGLITFMLSTNMLIKYVKRGNKFMHMPVDIASEEAKIAELEEKKVEKK